MRTASSFNQKKKTDSQLTIYATQYGPAYVTHTQKQPDIFKLKINTTFPLNRVATV